MVVKRDFSIKRYLVAAVITMLVFSFGVLLGVILDYERLDALSSKSEIQELDYRGLQLLYLYLSDVENDKANCVIMRATLEESIKDLSYSLEQYERYESNSYVNKGDFDIVVRTYLQDNLRYWLFSQKTRELCKDDVINVLYFYSKDKCYICPNQGTILTYFKLKLKDKILIFPINVDLEDDEKLIKMLRLQYNITSYPSIVVNDDTYSGIIPKDEVAKIICEHSRDKEKCFI